VAVPAHVREILALLSTDPHLLAECPNCAGNFSLKDSGLFYGNELNEAAQEYLTRRNEDIAEMKKKLLKSKKMATIGAAERARYVNVGKVLEKVAPSLTGFPFNKNDCRPIWEPIDYLVFQGLTNKMHIDRITFVDIKTGNAGLNEHQKQIKKAVEKGNVELQVLK